MSQRSHSLLNTWLYNKCFSILDFRAIIFPFKPNPSRLAIMGVILTFDNSFPADSKKFQKIALKLVKKGQMSWGAILYLTRAFITHVSPFHVFQVSCYHISIETQAISFSHHGCNSCNLGQQCTSIAPFNFILKNFQQHVSTQCQVLGVRQEFQRTGS